MVLIYRNNTYSGMMDEKISSMGTYAKRVAKEEEEYIPVVYLFDSMEEAEKALVCSLVGIKCYIRFERHDSGEIVARSGCVFASAMPARF